MRISRVTAILASVVVAGGLASCAPPPNFSIDTSVTCGTFLAASPEQQKTVGTDSVNVFAESGVTKTTPLEYVLEQCGELNDETANVAEIRTRLMENRFGPCEVYVTLEAAAKASWVQATIEAGVEMEYMDSTFDDPATYAVLVPTLDGLCEAIPDSDLIDFTSGQLADTVNGAHAAGASTAASLAEYLGGATAVLPAVSVTIQTTEGYSYALTVRDIEIDVIADVASAKPGEATLKWGSSFTVEIENTTSNHDAPGFGVSVATLYPAAGELCQVIGDHPRIVWITTAEGEWCSRSLGGVDAALSTIEVDGSLVESTNYPTEGGLVDVPESGSDRLAELAQSEARILLSVAINPDKAGTAQCVAGDCTALQILKG